MASASGWDTFFDASALTASATCVESFQGAVTNTSSVVSLNFMCDEATEIASNNCVIVEAGVGRMLDNQESNSEQTDGDQSFTNDDKLDLSRFALLKRHHLKRIRATTALWSEEIGGMRVDS